MLHTGMLWFDDAKGRPIGEKIERAAAYYEKKYGQSPDVCCVNAHNLTDSVVMERPIRVIGLDDVLPHHFWIGIADSTASTQH